MRLNEPAEKSIPLRARPWLVLTALVFFILVFLAGVWVLGLGLLKNESSNLAGSPLLDCSRVANIELHFTKENWLAMEPSGGQRMPGPGMGPGARQGPGSDLAKGLFSKADKDRDSFLERAEFMELATDLFGSWDKDSSQALSLEEIRAGFQGLLGQGLMPGPGLVPGANQSQTRRNGIAAMSGIEFRYVTATLVCDDVAVPQVSVRYKGNNTFMTSRSSLKRSLKVDINKGAPGRKLEGMVTLNLHNNVNDPSWMNECLSYRLYRDAGVPAPRTGYALVSVDVPEVHDSRLFGLYSIIENIDSGFARDRFGTKKGVLLKPVTQQLFEYLGEDWTAYERVYDPKTQISEEDTRHVIAFCRLVSQGNDAEFERDLERYLDLEAFARYMAVTTWLSTMDSLLSMGQNFVVYLHPKTRQFQFIPWDLDHSFGHFPMAGSSEQLEKLSINHPWAGNRLFLDRVFKVDQFRRLYLAALASINRRLCRPERLAAQVDELALLLRPAVAKESSEKLSRFDAQVRGEKAVQTQQRGPGGASNPIKAFAAARYESIKAQLAGQSEGYTPARGGAGGGRMGPGAPGVGPLGAGPGGGPAFSLAENLFKKLTVGEAKTVTKENFLGAFSTWFDAWCPQGQTKLTEAALAEGLSKTFLPRFGPDGGRGQRSFGPPPGADDDGPPLPPDAPATQDTPKDFPNP